MPLTAILNHRTVEIDWFHEQDRGQDFRCPACDDKMTLVFPEKRISHFRHLKSTCGLCETYEHLTMKKTAKDMLKKNNSGQFTFEKKVIQDGDFNIIDLEIIQQTRRIAVECQASSLADNLCMERTRALNRLGYSVLWLLSANNFDNLDDEKPIKQPEAFIHAINYGRVYYLKLGEESAIFPLHFNRIERTREVYVKEFEDGETRYFSEEPYDGEYDEYYTYTYTLSKKRRVVRGADIKNLSLLCQDSRYIKTGEVFRLARFFDKKFW